MSCAALLGCANASWSAVPEKDTYAVHAQNAGYRTSYAGKYLNAYGLVGSTDCAVKTDKGCNRVPPGWTDWHGLVGNSRLWNAVVVDDYVEIVGVFLSAIPCLFLDRVYLSPLVRHCSQSCTISKFRILYLRMTGGFRWCYESKILAGTQVHHIAAYFLERIGFWHVQSCRWHTGTTTPALSTTACVPTMAMTRRRTTPQICFLLGQKRFCKTTWHITRTHHFWRCLRRRPAMGHSLQVKGDSADAHCSQGMSLWMFYLDGYGYIFHTAVPIIDFVKRELGWGFNLGFLIRVVHAGSCVEISA